MTDIWTPEQVNAVGRVRAFFVMGRELLENTPGPAILQRMHTQLIDELKTSDCPSDIHPDDCSTMLEDVPDLDSKRVVYSWNPHRRLNYALDGPERGALYISKQGRPLTLEFRRMPPRDRRPYHINDLEGPYSVTTPVLDIYEYAGWSPTERAWAYKFKETI